MVPPKGLTELLQVITDTVDPALEIAAAVGKSERSARP
jgi:hypothetical protein